MKTRMIALFLTLAMVVSISPAVVADDTIPRPTVDEILNEYHQKAFEAEAVGEASTATYSPRTGSPEKTLEQETVDNLNAAGYEAYNVTSENYKSLEAQLQTDFGDMGLDPNGSYIITISGESSPYAQTTSGMSTRGRVPVPIPDGSSFTYTYNGTEYVMRYIIVTATDNTNLAKATPVNLLDEYGPDDLMNDLNIPITILSSLGALPYTGTIYSLLSAILPSTPSSQHSVLMYTGGTNWTITYTQIYNYQSKTWNWCASKEYTLSNYFINYTYYNSYNNQYVQDSVNGTLGKTYSALYNDSETLKARAALAYENGTYWIDDIEFVNYKFGNKTVITHYRWDEYSGYEPA